jgi:hypothetical protein
MCTEIVSHLLLVSSPEETAVKKLLSGEQLHHDVCSTA